MTTVDNASTVLSEADHRAQLRRAVIASTVGTTIEWYDFLLYSIVTGLAFGSGYVIAVYIFFCAVVSIVAAALMPDLTNRDISQEHA
jgi:hypothetical protein